MSSFNDYGVIDDYGVIGPYRFGTPTSLVTAPYFLCNCVIGVGPSQTIVIHKFSFKKRLFLPSITLFLVSKRAL
jgi:hypothetical protein